MDMVLLKQEDLAMASKFSALLFSGTTPRGTRRSGKGLDQLDCLAITTSHNIKSTNFGSRSLGPVSCGAIVKSDFSTRFSSTKSELGAL